MGFCGGKVAKCLRFADIKETFSAYLVDAIKSGAVKPLPRTVFQHDEIEKAFRYMASGKHVGKVIINIRPEETQKICLTPHTTFKGIPRSENALTFLSQPLCTIS